MEAALGFERVGVMSFRDKLYSDEEDEEGITAAELRNRMRGF